ncbi:MAG: hypothetical protein ACREOO_15705 [bacterium]
MQVLSKSQIIRKLESLPSNKVSEVLGFIESLLSAASTSEGKVARLIDQQASHALVGKGFVFIDDLGKCTLQDGKRIVWEPKPIRVLSKKKLVEYLDELITLAKTLTTDVELIAHVPGFDEQHAWLEIYVPDKLEDQIDNLVIERASDIFIETGYDIGVMVLEKTQFRINAA